MSSRPWKENNFFSLNLISKRRENDFVSVWLSYPVASIQTGNGSNSFSYFFLKFCLIKWTEKMVIDALIEDLSCCVCPHSRFIILPLRDVIKTRSRRYVYTLDSMVRVTHNVVINLQTKKKKKFFSTFADVSLSDCGRPPPPTKKQKWNFVHFRFYSLERLNFLLPSTSIPYRSLKRLEIQFNCK